MDTDYTKESIEEPFLHLPVLLNEVCAFLLPVINDVFIDGTIGGAGHSYSLLEAYDNQHVRAFSVVGVDKDDVALVASKERLAKYGDKIHLFRGCYSNMKKFLLESGFSYADAILIDLGVSSVQLDTPNRGFSFRFDAPLDMRMNTSFGVTAEDIINEYTADELLKIFREYGEEHQAFRYVNRIIEKREKQRITSTRELAEIIEKSTSIPKHAQKIHPATKIFQALRIAVNGELEALSLGLEVGFELLRKGGRIAVISFHSLEDRIVKNFFKEKSLRCKCPHTLPMCMCDNVESAMVITKKPLVASDMELSQNPRARSAKFRVLEKLL